MLAYFSPSGIPGGHSALAAGGSPEHRPRQERREKARRRTVRERTSAARSKPIHSSPASRAGQAESEPHRRFPLSAPPAGGRTSYVPTPPGRRQRKPCRRSLEVAAGDTEVWLAPAVRADAQRVALAGGAKVVREGVYFVTWGEEGSRARRTQVVSGRCSYMRTRQQEQRPRGRLWRQVQPRPDAAARQSRRRLPGSASSTRPPRTCSGR